MRALAALAVLALAGCPICPDGSMAIVGAPADGVVHAGDVVQLRATFGDWTADADHCGAHWYVNDQLGGDATVGTVDDCGRYRAPATFAPGAARFTIMASKYGIDNCSDCCPYASRTLTLAP